MVRDEGIRMRASSSRRGSTHLGPSRPARPASSPLLRSCTGPSPSNFPAARQRWSGGSEPGALSLPLAEPGPSSFSSGARAAQSCQAARTQPSSRARRRSQTEKRATSRDCSEMTVMVSGPKATPLSPNTHSRHPYHRRVDEEEARSRRLPGQARPENA